MMNIPKWVWYLVAIAAAYVIYTRYVGAKLKVAKATGS